MKNPGATETRYAESMGESLPPRFPSATEDALEWQQLGGSRSASATASASADDQVDHFEWSHGQWLYGKYRLNRLAGDGTFGRVCLATDMRKKKQVAIKIIRRKEHYTASAKIEALILAKINEADPFGQHRCSYMHDSFMLESGHFCIVLEPLGPNLYDFIKANHFRGFWLEDIQSMAKQILYSLSFLHERLDLTHTDLKLENILLASMAPGRISWFPRQDFWEASQEQAGNVCRKSPPYLRPWNVGIKLIDFGNATRYEDSHGDLINTRQYRGPEVILETGWDASSDLWSAGCIFMELYTGEMLFRTHESLEHLALIEQIIGPLPQHMTAKSPTKFLKKVSPRSGQWSLNWPEGASSQSSRDFVDTQLPLSQQVQQRASDLKLSDLVAALCKIDPAERLTAKQAMRHDFFSHWPEDEC